MSNGKIRVGIIGGSAGGSWGTQAHLPALRALPDFEVTAIATTKQETADQTAAAFSIPLAFGNPLDLARHSDVDVVSVCVRVPYHYDFVMAALDAGKHVFCEWPLGVDSRQAEAMLNRARAQKVRHMVGLQARVAPAIVHARDLVAGGYVGRVLSASLVCTTPWFFDVPANYAYLLDQATGASLMSIPGGHSIDALCHCLGAFQEISGIVETQIKHSIAAETGVSLERTSPDLMLAQGRLQNGAVASVQVKGSSAFSGEFHFDITGTAGRLVVRTTDPAQSSVQIAALSLYGHQDAHQPLAEITLPAKSKWVSDAVPARPAINVAQLYAQFRDAIQGRKAELPDFSAALQNHLLLEAISRASETGQRQTLPNAV